MFSALAQLRSAIGSATWSASMFHARARSRCANGHGLFGSRRRSRSACRARVALIVVAIGRLRDGWAHGEMSSASSRTSTGGGARIFGASSEWGTNARDHRDRQLRFGSSGSGRTRSGDCRRTVPAHAQPHPLTATRPARRTARPRRMWPPKRCICAILTSPRSRLLAPRPPPGWDFVGRTRPHTDSRGHPHDARGHTQMPCPRP